MYLHLGQDTVVLSREVIGIFDIDNCSISKHTRAFLAASQRAGRVTAVSAELPKSFVLAGPRGRERLYISQISPATLKKRWEETQADPGAI